jgi:hypothetical protein
LERQYAAKAAVGAVAAALPDVRLLVLAGQQHVADILDLETFATYLLDFLHARTLSHVVEPFGVTAN